MLKNPLRDAAQKLTGFDKGPLRDGGGEVPETLLIQGLEVLAASQEKPWSLTSWVRGF
jgi:hypothetical protein